MSSSFTMSIDNRVWAIGLSMLLAVCLSGAVSAQELREFDADYLESPNGPDLGEATEMVVQLTNEFRREQGLNELETDSHLHRTARYYAAYMARTNEFGHEADGNRPAERASLFGYEYCMVAENIAVQSRRTGFRAEVLAQEFVEGWQESPRHRENLLNAHMTETGVAIGHDPRTGRFYAVQLFGRPRDAAIEFQVTNRTRETIQYTVAAADNGDTRRSYELPPRATMFHTRCRPPRIDWGWTEADDDLRPQADQAYVITLEAGEHRVAQQPARE